MVVLLVVVVVAPSSSMNDNHIWWLVISVVVNLSNSILNRTNNLQNIIYTKWVTARLTILVRQVCIVVSTLVPKIMEYSSMAAPIYATWGIDADTCYEIKNVMQ